MDALAEALVGPADRKGRSDLRMRAAGELDLERRHLVAAAVNELLLAAADLDYPGLALAREVAGGEPAVADRCGRGLVEVAAHEERARDVELAELALRHGLTVIVEDAEAHAGRRPSDAAGVALGLVRHQEEVAGRRLRKAVDVDELRRAEKRAQRRAEAGAERLAADQHLLERACRGEPAALLLELG